MILASQASVVVVVDEDGGGSGGGRFGKVFCKHFYALELICYADLENDVRVSGSIFA